MITIPILYSAQLPSLEASADAVTGQSGTLQIRFTFSEDWDAYPRRTAMFISKAAARLVLLNEEGCAIVPASVIPHGVSILRISVFGNAEDESGTVVRLYDVSGQDQSVTLTMCAPVKAAYLTNIHETLENKLECDGNKVVVTVPKYSVVTVKVAF